ncbi:MAG: hypothetical protein IKR50_02045 [Prevotella sp.]|nr:hypothetical protein [Prevotella sp.]
MESITTMYTMIGSSMSAKIVDSSSAVTIYFAMSISHLPNSFFILAAKLSIIPQTAKGFAGKKRGESLKTTAAGHRADACGCKTFAPFALQMLIFSPAGFLDEPSVTLRDAERQIRGNGGDYFTTLEGN